MAVTVNFFIALTQKFEGIPCDESGLVGKRAALSKTSPYCSYVRYFVLLPGSIKGSNKITQITAVINNLLFTSLLVQGARRQGS